MPSSMELLPFGCITLHNCMACAAHVLTLLAACLQHVSLYNSMMMLCCVVGAAMLSLASLHLFVLVHRSLWVWLLALPAATWRYRLLHL